MNTGYETELPPDLCAALDAANLPEGVVLRRNKHGKWVGYKEAACRRLESLGPFATTQAQLDFKFLPESERYYIDFAANEKFGVPFVLHILHFYLIVL